MTEGAMINRPTIRERFWRALGFRYHLVDLPHDIEQKLPGWMMTRSLIAFSLSDRVRLLLTGRLYLDLRQASDVSVSEVHSALSFRIGAPGCD